MKAQIRESLAQSKRWLHPSLPQQSASSTGRRIPAFPAVYRTPESMKGASPLGMLGTFLAMLAPATLYVLAYRNGSRIAEGLRFGFLVGVFAWVFRAS